MNCKDCKHYTQGEGVAGGRCPLRAGHSLHPEDHCLAKRTKPGTEDWEQPMIEPCFEAKPIKTKPVEKVEPMLPPDPQDCWP